MKEPVLAILTVLFNIYFYVLITRVILSYVTSNIQTHPISLFIIKITDPLLRKLRSIIPDQMIGNIRIDVALILLLLFYKLFVRLIIQIFSAILL